MSYEPLVERDGRVLGKVFPQRIMGKRTGRWEWRGVGGLPAGVADSESEAEIALVAAQDASRGYWQQVHDALRGAR